MIYGIGTDLVSIPRIRQVIQRWGERFVGRVFTLQETRICSARQSPSSSFALRFAAKEAFAKALGLGMRKGVKWKDIEVFHDPAGKPCLRLHGECLQICRKAGISRSHLSLSDEGEYGVAMVVLEIETEKGAMGTC